MRQDGDEYAPGTDRVRLHTLQSPVAEWFMAKSKPFTVRLSLDTQEWLQQEARRTHLPKGTLLEALAGEGVRMRRFPGIAFRGFERDRRAWVVGTGLDVWEVVEGHDEMGRERLLRESSLSTRTVVEP
jgi:hypothetical protein